jgi:hypothetical protein
VARRVIPALFSHQPAGAKHTLGLKIAFQGKLGFKDINNSNHITPNIPEK